LNKPLQEAYLQANPTELKETFTCDIRVYAFHKLIICVKKNEICYGRYAIGDYCKLVTFIFLHSAIPTRWLLEVVKWNGDDANAHDSLRKLITNLT
jgi:hypothetical protein